MTQYIRPDADVSASNWTGAYSDIDEAVASDADYIIGENTANGTFICGLGDPAATPSTTTCTIRFRARKDAAAGHDRQVSVQVFEGTTARGAAVSSGNLDENWTEYSSAVIDLSAVSDWTALRFNIVSAGDTGTPAASRRYVWVSHAVLETPDGVAAYSLVCAQGSFALTGQAMTPKAGRKLALAQGGITLTGQAVTLTATRKLVCALGEFALSGQDVTLDYAGLNHYTLICAQGSFALTGQAIGLIADRLLAIAQGGLSLTGQSVTLQAARLLSASVGSYAITGYDAGVIAARLLVLSYGALALIGRDVTLTFSVMVTSPGYVTGTDRQLYSVVASEEELE